VSRIRRILCGWDMASFSYQQEEVLAQPSS